MRLVCVPLLSGSSASRARRCSGSISGAFVIVGVGGILGSLLVGWLELPAFGGLGLADGVSATIQFGVQLLSVAITIGWTVLASYVILQVISLAIGLRVDQQDEIEGLDLSQHGERGYHSN